MDFLDRLEKFMDKHRGSTVALNGPAAPAELKAAQAAMGVVLPADVCQAYLRFNGVARQVFVGQPFPCPRGPALFLPSYDWVSLDQMVRIWQNMRAIDSALNSESAERGLPENELPAGSRMRLVDWHCRWIPIGSNGAFDTVYVDLAPVGEGVDGQLIYAGDSASAGVAATSFSAYVTRLLDALESGKLCLDGDGVWRTVSGDWVSRLQRVGA